MGLLTLMVAQAIQESSNQIVATSSTGGNGAVWIFLGIIALLVFLFFYFLKRTNRIVEERERGKMSENELVTNNYHEVPPEEVTVAIALALSMYKVQLSEMENLSLTIQKVSKMYSPWSSKIYTLRRLP
jgi:glutaconyl-CoA/methylmalonyl-CoA decarboxylase subunit delta